VRYDNDCEWRKRTCNDIRALEDVGCRTWPIFSNLGLSGVVALIAHRIGIESLTMDSTFHGGGLHVTDPGGWLSPHLDYSRHPKLPDMERRLNLVLFLNPEWREEWGGAFELYDDAGAEVVARVYPKFNSAVLWEPTDVAFHGTQKVTDDAPPRVSLAVYYLAPARPNCTRKRALFVPRR
jgi:hypothetical protein